MVLPTIDEGRYLMQPHQQQQQDRYEDEFDLEDNESDTTRVSATSYQKPGIQMQRDPSYASTWSDAIIPHSGSTRKSAVILTWIRWSVVISLQSIMIVLLLWPYLKGARRETEAVLKGKRVETGGDINGLYETLSHSYTYLKPEVEKYVPNMTTNENRMEIRRNWDLLMPLGSGSVGIPEYRDHPLLGEPIDDDPIRSGPLFEASWTHALHCLYYSVDSYHQLIVNGRSEKDNPRHASHCFEYLRNSILCNLDMTLEGSMSTYADKDRGQPHVCRNRQEAIAWIEARRVDDFQDIVGP